MSFDVGPSSRNDEGLSAAISVTRQRHSILTDAHPLSALLRPLWRFGVRHTSRAELLPSAVASMLTR
jgi:hypothetical protein